ncbi:MAG: pyridoxal-phosphate dependent enzyme, partial [Bacteroidota bacterium]
ALTRVPDQVEKLDETQALIGDTPLIPLEVKGTSPGVTLHAKLEARQLGQSVEGRVAFAIIKEAMLEGRLMGDVRLLDASTERLAIAYASIAARLKVSLTLVMSNKTSASTLHKLAAFGAEVRLLAEGENTQAFAKDLALSEPEAYYFADHRRNDESWKVHYLGTAKEIYHQTRGQITHFVANSARRDILLGTGKKLKEVNREIVLVALTSEREPDERSLDYADKTIYIDPQLIPSRVDRFAKEAGMIISEESAFHLIGMETLAESLDAGTLVTIFPHEN